MDDRDSLQSDDLFGDDVYDASLQYGDGSSVDSRLSVDTMEELTQRRGQDQTAPKHGYMPPGPGYMPPGPGYMPHGYGYMPHGQGYLPPMPPQGYLSPMPPQGYQPVPPYGYMPPPGYGYRPQPPYVPPAPYMPPMPHVPPAQPPQQDVLRSVVDSLTLPKCTLGSFDGNPLNYYTFMNMFDSVVDNTTISAAAKLSRLLECCKGRAANVIEPCILLPPERGYASAGCG